MAFVAKLSLFVKGEQEKQDHVPITPPVYVPPVPIPVQQNRIKIWALAIQHNEGGKPNDLNTQLRNPGNLKYTQLTASLGGKPGPKGSDGGVFCKFDTYEQGFNALCRFLNFAASGQLKSYKATMTLRQFTQIYANPPTQAYAKDVAARLGVSVDVMIQDLLKAS